MKIITTSLLMLTFLFVPYRLISQSQEFIQGYMITTSQDTIYGFIKDEKRVILSEQFLFKKTLEQTAQTISPELAIGFYIAPSFHFEQVDFKQGGMVKKLFLRKLVTGTANLYQYFKNPAYQYVITKQSGESTQISKKDSLTIAGVIADNKYIGQLKYLLRESPTIRAAKTFRFHERSLIGVVNEYNKFINPAVGQDLGDNRKLALQIGAMGGLRTYNMTVSKNQLPNVAYEDNNLGFQIGGLANLSYFRRVSLQLGVLYTTYAAENETTSFLGTITVSSKVRNIEFPIGLKLNLSTKVVSPYLYGGIRFANLLENTSRRIRFQSDVLISDDTYKLDFDSIFGIDFGIGLTLKKNRLGFSPQIELMYSRLRTSFGQLEDVGVNSLNLNAKIFFGK